MQEWYRLIPKLTKQYPSRNRGFDSSNKRVFAVIAEMYGIHPRTVYRHLSPKVSMRTYWRNYSRLRRHLDKVLPKVFNGDSELSLQEVTNRVGDSAGVKVREATLENILGKCESNRGCSPLVKSDSGNYCLNPSFYTK